MAGKRKSNASNNRQTWGQADLEFASWRLSREEGEKFIEWYKSNAPEFESAVLQVVNDLYKVQFRVDMNNSAHVVAFTQQDDRHPHYAVYLTSRSDDPVEAFFMNCYKIWEMFPGKKIAVDVTADNLWG